MNQSQKTLRNGRRTRKRSNPARTDSLLSQLVLLNKQQTTRPAPIIADQMRMSRPSRDKLYTFFSTITGPQLNSSASIEVDGAITTTLSAQANASAWTSLFDAYRCIQVTVCFYPAATPPSSGSEGPLYTAIDYDDASTTLLSSLIEYDTLQVVPPGTYFERTFEPRASQAMYSGAFTSFGQLKAPWIDSASPSVVFYGLKYALPNGTTATNLWNTTVTSVWQFRQVR